MLRRFMPMMSWRRSWLGHTHMRSVLGHRFEPPQLQQAVAGVVTQQQDKGHDNQLYTQEIKGEMAYPRIVHRQISEHRSDQAAATLNQHFLGTFLFPQNRHSLNGPGQNDHGEKSDGQAGIEAHAIRDYREDRNNRNDRDNDR